MPIACRLGTDCWLMNYPDVSADAGAVDPACGHRTYDGHKGTDIAIRDHAAMRHGMDVLAAAGGSVLRGRDGVMDHYGPPAGQGTVMRQRNRVGPWRRLGDPVMPSAPGQYCGKIGPAL